MTALLLSADLMTLSSAQGAADRAGVELLTANSIADAVEKCAAHDVRFLAADLRLPNFDPAQLMRELKSRSSIAVRVLAFAPHVHESLLFAAHAAGCDEVVTRGQFEGRFAAAVAQLAAAS